MLVEDKMDGEATRSPGKSNWSPKPSVGRISSSLAEDRLGVGRRITKNCQNGSAVNALPEDQSSVPT